MRKTGIAIGMMFCLLVCSCGGDKQEELSVTYDRNSVLEMLSSVSDTTMILLENIDQSGLSPTEKYALLKTTVNLLQQQNAAYALLCEGELTQALKDVEEVRLLTVKTQVELDYEKRRMRTNEPLQVNAPKKTDKMKYPERNHSNMRIDYPKERSMLMSPSKESGSLDSQHWNILVTGSPYPQVVSDGKNTWHVHAGTNNPVTITVTNNNKPVDVVWTWNDATVSIYSNNVQSGKTECRSIKVALRGGKTKGKVQFKLKEEKEFKCTVWLEPTGMNDLKHEL